MPCCGRGGGRLGAGVSRPRGSRHKRAAEAANSAAPAPAAVAARNRRSSCTAAVRSRAGCTQLPAQPATFLRAVRGPCYCYSVRTPTAESAAAAAPTSACTQAALAACILVACTPSQPQLCLSPGQPPPPGLPMARLTLCLRTVCSTASHQPGPGQRTLNCLASLPCSSLGRTCTFCPHPPLRAFVAVGGLPQRGPGSGSCSRLCSYARWSIHRRCRCPIALPH
mmetsp:Transcript_2781/g.7217  ORF Transcript_2781/g.7217 Transcript_2781/m.7217 type:complete len:224 (-) Transcript_2781:1073-1744(-)